MVWDFKDLRRAAEEPAKTDLVDNGDGTVTDPRTGLMWQAAEDGVERTYDEALEYCKDLTLGGHRDWQLPAKEELAGLAKLDLETLQRVFPEIKEDRYWAYTTMAELTWSENPARIAYTVDFDNYRSPVTYFRTYSYFVRAVRGRR